LASKHSAFMTRDCRRWPMLSIQANRSGRPSDTSPNSVQHDAANYSAGLDLASIPQPTHDAAIWEERTKNFDFSQEDGVDPEVFNRVIWKGLMSDKPYPTNRSGVDLRQHREQLLKSQSTASVAEGMSGGGSR
jgi:hypothetical protein